MSMNKLGPETRWAWKAINPNLTTRNGFLWPIEGDVESSGPWEIGAECPRTEGDGLCLAKTPAGAASGGYNPLHSTVLLVSFEPGDVLGEGPTKVRVKRCQTHGLLDARAALIHPGAYLSRANLTGADLTGADLTGAYLPRADLTEADLSRADLSRANLTGAYLSRADLTEADLSRADLSRANLYGSNLSRANLYGSNLSRADLTGADLTGADLTGAYLYGSNLSKADLTGSNLTGASSGPPSPSS